MTTQKLLLVRHGYTGDQYAGKYIGSLDVPIAEKGRQQAYSVTEKVKPCEPVRCFCSPMQRTRQTAEIVVENLSEVEFCDDLREVDFGRWEGLSFENICGQDPGLVEVWAKEGLDFCFPGGESNRDFLERVHTVAQKIANSPEQTILVVSHGGVIRAMICYFLGLDSANYLLFDVKPARLTVLDLFDGKGVLQGFNL